MSDEGTSEDGLLLIVAALVQRLGGSATVTLEEMAEVRRLYEFQPIDSTPTSWSFANVPRLWPLELASDARP